VVAVNGFMENGNMLSVSRMTQDLVQKSELAMGTFFVFCTLLKHKTHWFDNENCSSH
jgi:hypothetical protein